MRNLVTGGGGFLGSHLIDRLMIGNEEVICLDDFSSANMLNIKHWIGNKRFQLLTHDITRPIQLNVDRIWHLACPASPIHYQRNPIKTSQTSFLGTYNMLEMANANKAKILLASSSEVYGYPEIHPQPETYHGSVNPIGIRSCYYEGKRMAESLCFDYLRVHKLKISIARIFNTYGPRMQPEDGRVISNFICQALNKLPLTVYGEGFQTRSFCYVDDLIEGLVKLMKSSHTGPINLGNPDEYRIIDLANIIRNKINPSIQIAKKPLPEDDPIKRKPDIKVARSLLKWNPKINIDLGLNNTIKYYKGNQ